LNRKLPPRERGGLREPPPRPRHRRGRCRQA
jgi:hypothetical protein